MSTEILCHPHENSSFQKCVEGGALAVLAFAPSFAFGFYMASRLMDGTLAEMAPVAQTIAVCFSVWSMYLFYDLHRCSGSLKRLLLWGAVIGTTMGYVSFVAIC